MARFRPKPPETADEIRPRLSRVKPSDAKPEEVGIGATIKETEEADA
jgi:hypothetical protein